MKKLNFLITTLLLLSLTSCNSSSSKNSTSNYSNYDYDKGYGYTEPKSGESASDYIKRQDPDLYDDMKDIYESNTSDYKKGNSSTYDYDKGYGYTEPKSGESFSDYIKRQDPDLYNSMQDRYDSLK